MLANFYSSLNKNIEKHMPIAKRNNENYLVRYNSIIIYALKQKINTE